ncbi:MAG: ABC transporter substrate-binding protein [Xanthobacteraceae bacterium]|nr:ABC transporter substrate-binding protein [Xanthobacteraceae bacterium]
MQPIKIGFMLPLSGPAAGGSAEGGQQGLRLAVDEINSRHLAARPFEAIIADDASDPRTAAEVCKRLIFQDKVDAIISQGPTANRMACNQAALKAGIPHLAALSGPGGMCIANLFMIGPETSQTLHTLVRQIVKDGNTKLYYMGADSSPIRDALPPAMSAAEAAGGTIIGSSFSPSGTTDFSSELAKIAAARPDAVIMMLMGADAVTFSRQFGGDDRVAAIKRADFLMTEKALHSLGRSGANIYSAASYYSSVPGEAGMEFKASLTRMYGEMAAPDVWAVMAYNAVHALAKAVTSPSSGAKEILEALPNISVDGPEGRIKISGRYISTPVFVGKTDGVGRVQIVATYSDVPPAAHCK